MRRTCAALGVLCLLLAAANAELNSLPSSLTSLVGENGIRRSIRQAVAAGQKLKNMTVPDTTSSDRHFSAMQSNVMVGDNGVTSHHFTFPGMVAQADFISDKVLVVSAANNIYATRDHGKNWECWTDGTKYGGVLAGKVRVYWTQTDALSTDNLVLSVRSEYGSGMAVATAAKTFYIETTLGSTIAGATELQIADSAALRKFPQLKPGSVSFDALEFHPTQPTTTAFAFLADPSCNALQSSCRNFAFITTNMKDFYLIPLFEPSVLMWENPVAPGRVNFTEPPIKRSRFDFTKGKCYSANDFFMIVNPNANVRDVGALVRVPVAGVEWATITESALKSKVKTVEANALYAVAIDGFEYIATNDRKTNKPILLVSNNNFMTSVEADFPDHIFHNTGDYTSAETAYTVLDSTESVFINVYRAAGTKHQLWGHTYVSGAHGLRYTLSLPYTRTSFGRVGVKADFHRVAGLDGVLIANVISNHRDSNCQKCVSHSCETACHYVTVLSRDNGKTWQRIPAPKGTAASGSGAETSSAGLGSLNNAFGTVDERDDVTSLHLHGLTSHMAVSVPGILSSRHAPGLLLAHGNVGTRLMTGSSGQVFTQVYMSRDGGESWTQIADSPHLYDEGDLGALLYMAPQQTNAAGYHLNFSTDAGATFLSTAVLPSTVPPIRFTWTGRPKHDPLVRVALVMGYDQKGRTHAVFVDFSGKNRRRCQHLHEPGTDDSDFETFTPRSYYSEVEGGEGCLLGRSTVYTRRKQGKNCWINAMAAVTAVDYALPASTTNCQCTIDDFECDFGYEEAAGGQCHKTSSAPTPAQICAAAAKKERWAAPFVNSHHQYRTTLGFRKIDGDTCVAGVTTQLIPANTWAPCDASAPESSSWVSGVVVFLFLAVCFTVLYKVNPRVRQAVDMTLETVAPQLVRIVGRGRAAVSNMASRHRYGALPTDDRFPDDPEDDAEIPTAPATAPAAAAAVHEEDPDDTDLEGQTLTDV